MRLDEIVKSRLDDLRVVVLEDNGEERADGHELPPEQEDNEIVRREQNAQAGKGHDEREPMKRKLTSNSLVMRQVTRAINCANCKNHADNNHEPCGERVAQDVQISKDGVMERGNGRG